MSFPVFDRAVPPGGYTWWYVDALDASGRYGATVIAFIGSVFSPYYFDARQRSRDVDPRQYCAINIALYGPKGRWTMTERGAAALETTADTLAIGNSRLTWHGDRLVIDIDERATPIPRSVRGQLVIRPRALVDEDFALDGAGAHHWHPVSPRCEVSARFDAPALGWQGTGYLDHNRGNRSLETDFDRWQWARADTAETSTIHYDVITADGDERGLALVIDRHGQVSHRAPAPWQALPPTRLWRMWRDARTDTPGKAHITRTLEDTPFYSRSEIVTDLDGQAAHGVHESLSMPRFVSPWARTLLRFRMPRYGQRTRR